MMMIHQIISTGFGIGYMRKGSGTVAAALFSIAWYFLFRSGEFVFLPIGVLFVLIVLGIWSASEVDKIWGKDSNRVVIDEMAGMALSVLLLPVTPQVMIVGFVLFRLFDITKPFYIRRLENLPKGWGVMMDDLLAGLYTNLLMQTMVRFNVL